MQTLGIDESPKPNHAGNMRTLIDRFGFKTAQIGGRNLWRVYHPENADIVGEWLPMENRLEFSCTGKNGEPMRLSLFQAIVQTRNMEELACMLPDNKRLSAAAKDRQAKSELAAIMYQISAAITYHHPQHADVLVQIADEVSDIIHEASRESGLLHRLGDGA